MFSRINATKRQIFQCFLGEIGEDKLGILDKYIGK